MPDDTPDKIEVEHGKLKSSIPTVSDHKIHPYKIPFAKTPADDGNLFYDGWEYRDYNEKAQAQKMFADFKKVLAANEDAKIAITYSANDQEAKDIVAAYNTGTNITLGTNQGAVIQELIKLINVAGLQKQIHILPVATMKYVTEHNLIEFDEPQQNSKETKIAVTEKEVIRDIRNIWDHLNGNWIVLGWQNQDTPDGKYAIGGGVSEDVWKDSQDKDNPSLKQLCDHALKLMTDKVLTEEDISGTDFVNRLKEDLKNSTNPFYTSTFGMLKPPSRKAPPPPTPSITANNNLIVTCDWKKLNENTQYNQKFVFTENTEENKANLKGWISKKDNLAVRLVEIEANKLKLPPNEQGNPKADQAEAVVAAFKQLVDHAKSKPSNLPLNITANDAFTEKQLKTITSLLLTENLPIRLHTHSQIPEIINLIKGFNNKNISNVVQYPPPNFTISPEAKTSGKPQAHDHNTPNAPPPSLRVVPPNK